MFDIQEFEDSLKVPDEIEYLHTPCPVDNGNQSSDLDDDYLEIVELAKELGIENWLTNLGGGVMYQEGFNRTISVQSILLPRHSFMKGISVVFGIGDEKQHLKIRLLTIKTKIRVQSLSCNLYANCDRCSSVGVVAISKIFGKVEHFIYLQHCLYTSEVKIDIGFVQRQITQRTKLGKPARRAIISFSLTMQVPVLAFESWFPVLAVSFGLPVLTHRF
ncbi:hypothetical protein Avbf_07092 [Armadillidium vulgare]|nr:hypothetical protein Avbf_07092 [Armadillidium vulgare]